MLNKIYLLLLILNIHHKVFAQLFSISGKITDAETGNVIGNASVFLSNTSYGTVTNSKGEFVLNNIRQGKYDLIVSYVGYETFAKTISNESVTAQLNIQLKQKARELKDVTVKTYDKNGWQNWGQFFTDNFIGASLYSKSCTIKNTDVIRFSFSKKKNELTAFATEPLIIENKALGYIIRYQLEDFTYQFTGHYLFYAGYPLFEDMKGGKGKIKRWAKARADVYDVSMMHFMRSLYRNKLKQDGYQMYHLKRIPNVEKQRWMAKEKNYFDTVSHKVTIMSYASTLPADSFALYDKYIHQKDPIEIIEPVEITGDSIAYAEDSVTAAIDFKDFLIVRYLKRVMPDEYFATTKSGGKNQPVSSTLNLLNNKPVYITSNGYYYNVEDLLSEGFWGWWEKMGNTLPYDYVPPAAVK